MQKKVRTTARITPALWLTLMLSVLLVMMVACGPATLTNNPTAATGLNQAPAGESLYVLDGYPPLSAGTEAQKIIAFHPGAASATFTLPAGLTSQDHRRLYTATTAHGQTTIAIINTQTGAKMHSFAIPGAYSTAGQSFDYAVMTLDGRWLALREVGQADNRTTIALVDTRAGKLVKTIQLNGDFYLDAISPDGNNLYLLQRLNDGSGHYYVRLYNVAESELYEYYIVDKTEWNDPRMTGTALTRQMSGDGSMAYTLYIDTARNIAFVHVLPLGGASFPFARCVNLPAGKSGDLLRYYTLALSPGGDTLYTANSALGVINEIHLGAPGSNDIWNDKVVAAGHFNPGSINMTVDDQARMLYNGAVLSADGSMLYFVGVHGIWAASTSDLHVKSHYLIQQAFTGLALSADGRTLYAVDPLHGITPVNAATGQPEQVIQGPVHSPWGIEWVSN